MDETALQSKINDILGADEELFISDYEAPIKINEYDSISDLNDLAGKLAEIQETDDVIAAISNEVLGSGYPREKLIEILTDHEYYIVEEVWTETDLAIKVDESFLPFDYKVVDAARASGYIDWEAVGRDMVISGWTITGKGLAVLVYK
jgi:antirestriction protein